MPRFRKVLNPNTGRYVYKHGEVANNLKCSRSILPPAEDEKSVNIPDAELCIICKDRKSCTVIIDCGHANLCITCVRHLVLDEEITTCPTCRAKMTNIIKIFR